MTVKCLNTDDKDFIVSRFQEWNIDINYLATLLNVSRRTIIRVLQERGVDPGLRKRTVKVKLLPMPSVEDMSGFFQRKEIKVEYQEGLAEIPRDTPAFMKVEMLEPKPWWKRFTGAMRRAFA